MDKVSLVNYKAVLHCHSTTNSTAFWGCLIGRLKFFPAIFGPKLCNVSHQLSTASGSKDMDRAWVETRSIIRTSRLIAKVTIFSWRGSFGNVIPLHFPANLSYPKARRQAVEIRTSGKYYEMNERQIYEKAASKIHFTLYTWAHFPSISACISGWLRTGNFLKQQALGYRHNDGGQNASAHHEIICTCPCITIHIILDKGKECALRL